MTNDEIEKKFEAIETRLDKIENPPTPQRDMVFEIIMKILLSFVGIPFIILLKGTIKEEKWKFERDER